MVLYYYDMNEILPKPIKNRVAETICNYLLNIHYILKSRVSGPKCYIMENECSSDLKEAMRKYTIDFQLDPPHMHRKISAEQDIITCKNHFIYGLATADPYLPIVKWD